MTTTGSHARAIFLEAIEQDSPENRADFLDRACQDNSELRARVERLLESHQLLGSFHDDASPGPMTVDSPIAESPGAVIGPYKLLQQIGEGGMGVVFMAEQEHPVRRKVALKIIKPGMDTRQVIARFEAERQALALMEHQNIARVFDGGATESGRPYFVMELVHGVPITEYCNLQKLTPPERLRLFTDVCRAVQHAHQKGIIHRDLKSSNVMVTMHDERPVPKIIDFGVSKAISHQLTEKTLFTAYGQMVGTPMYMSPEQAQLSGLDVDTRSDVYSLGVLLYELTTGTTPFDEATFKRVGFDEMRRMIREDEPLCPSARINTVDADQLSTIADQRNVDPHKLRHSLRGEVDWIVMKCLEKDRNRRYETANALAQDIERSLADEPVLACPPSARYRLRKLARKYRRSLAVAAAFVLLLVTATAVSIGLAAWALQAKSETRQALERETAARKRTRQALARISDRIVEETFARKVQLAEEDKEFLRQILKDYEAFAAEMGDSAEARELRAEGHARVGFLRQKLGELPDAAAAHGAAREIWAGLAADFPPVSEYRLNLAETYNNLGVLLSNYGRLNDAEAAYRDAVTIQTKLVADFPTVPEHRKHLARSQHNMSVLLSNTGRLEDAEVACRAALEAQTKLATDFPAVSEYRQLLAGMHTNLGALLSFTGRPTEAEDACRAALTVSKQLTVDFPSVPEYRENLARVHNNLGVLMSDMGRYEDAEAAYGAALAIQKKLAADFPTLPVHLQYLAKSHNNLGNLLMNSGRQNDAETAYRNALEIQTKLTADFTDVPEYRRDLAGSHNNLGLLLRDIGRPKDAEMSLRTALEIQTRLVAEFPTVPSHRRELAASNDSLGNLLSLTGPPNDAEAAYGAGLEIIRQLVDEFPQQPDLRNDLAGSLVNLAKLQNTNMDFASARRLLEEARPHHQAALEANPDNPSYREFWRNNRWALCDAQLGLEDHAELANVALELTDIDFSRTDDAYNAACYLARSMTLAETDVKLPADKRTELTQQYAEQAVSLLKQAVAAGYADAEHMKKDEDLAPLRLRDDFKNLLEQLEIK